MKIDKNNLIQNLESFRPKLIKPPMMLHPFLLELIKRNNLLKLERMIQLCMKNNRVLFFYIIDMENSAYADITGLYNEFRS